VREAWQVQEERGSRGLIRFVIWIALHVGHTAGHFLVFPICLYFLTFSVRARRASADYLRRVLGRAPGVADLYRHYHCFAMTLLDRPYFVTGQFASYDIRVHGEDVMLAIHRSGRGGVVMGAHIGSFEVLRSFASTCEWLDLKVMMDMDVSRHTDAIVHDLNPSYAKNIIALGRPDSVIRAYESIADGGFVGILADRNARGGKYVTVPFMGQDAVFPKGPMMLAAAAKCPVVTVFGIYRGGRRYDIYFEKLCDLVPGDYRGNPDTIQALVADFAGLVEARCREAPYNWFNFFEFWKGNEK
jgi:predicted LPLAT superfamily acyltransferase